MVFNTCCIRENADNKLYGHLGHLKTLRRAPARACRSRWAAAWPRRTGSGSARGLPRRRRLRDPQPRPGRPSCSGAARDRAGGRDLGRAGAGRPRRPGRPPCHAVRDSPTRPGSPSRPAATTRARSASCRAVRGGEVQPARSTSWSTRSEGLARRGVSEVTLLGPERELVRAGDLTRRRPLFAELLRAVGAVDGIRRVRFTSPHPKDLRPETIAAMAETAGGVRAAPPAAPVGERRDAVGHAPGLHGRAVPGAAGRGPGGHAGPRRDHRHHRGLPRRDRGRLRAHAARSRPRPGTTAPTPSSSRPGPGTRAAAWSSGSCPTTWWPSASSGCGWWSSGQRSPGTRRASGGSRRSWWRGRPSGTRR